MPVNPNQKAIWRPEKEFARAFVVTLGAPEPFNPADEEEAIEHTLQVGSEEIDAYKGYPDVQRDIAATLARKRYPGLFGVRKLDAAISVAQARTNVVEEWYNARSSGGKIDWGLVARDTIYVAYVEKLPETVEVLEPTPLHSVVLEEHLDANAATG